MAVAVAVGAGSVVGEGVEVGVGMAVAVAVGTGIEVGVGDGVSVDFGGAEVGVTPPSQAMQNGHKGNNPQYPADPPPPHSVGYHDIIFLGRW